jgi:predicted O-linked N-acetylglucosamine transferase (SPINDLY family)
LPVLTCEGNTFPGRVATSLLKAVGLPELITHSMQAYEELAIDLAKHPDKLQAVQNKLIENRLNKPLFNTEFFTKNLEALYQQMHERHQQNLGPDHLLLPSIDSSGGKI